MRILITGSAGFLGSHLALYYLEKGDEVVGIDDFSTSSPHSEHFKILSSNSRYKHIKWNISKLTECSSVFLELLEHTFDVILNFACPASPPKYEKLALHTIETCTIGLMNILDIAVNNGSRVVHASTSEVYGDPDPEIGSQCETYWGNVNPYGPRGCYDNGKRMAETICYEYRKRYGLDVRMVRIFNTYGDSMDKNDGRVVSNFICQALENKPLTIYGDGSQTRSFCYVDDLVDGITRLACLIENDGTPINLGNSGEFSITHLASLVLQLIPESQSRIEFRTIPIDDPVQRKPDISKAERELNWKPKIDLKSGLEKTIPYFRKLLK